MDFHDGISDYSVVILKFYAVVWLISYLRRNLIVQSNLSYVTPLDHTEIKLFLRTGYRLVQVNYNENTMHDGH